MPCHEQASFSEPTLMCLFWYFNLSTIFHILILIIVPCKSLPTKLVQLPGTCRVVSKGASPQGVTHTFVSFHNAGFVRGDLPNKLHARGGYANRSEQSKCLARSPGGWQCPQTERWAWVSSHWLQWGLVRGSLSSGGGGPTHRYPDGPLIRGSSPVVWGILGPS